MPDHPLPDSHVGNDLTPLLAQVSLDLQAIQRLARLAQQPDLDTDDRVALARATQRLAGSAGCLTDAAQWPDQSSVASAAADWLMLPGHQSA